MATKEPVKAGVLNPNAPVQRAANPILNTSDAEVPNVEGNEAVPAQKQEDVEAAFGSPIYKSYVDNIPESQGDMADRAELEIENEIQAQIDFIRRMNKAKQPH